MIKNSLAILESYDLTIIHNFTILKSITRNNNFMSYGL